MLVNEAVTVTALAGITGSASGGMSIALATMADSFIAGAQSAGIPLEVLHRIAAMASGGMDTLPHNGAVITLLAVTGLTHKESLPRHLRDHAAQDRRRGRWRSACPPPNQGDPTTQEGDSMTRTMKAAVVRAFKATACHRGGPGPDSGPGQILVKIAASGVCHTDLHAADGDWPVKPKPPFIPGHEGVGHVAAVGAGVSHVKEGDRVGVPWLYTACGHCRHCLGGWETLCESSRTPAIR